MYSFESRKELYFFGDNGRKLKQRILAIELQKKTKNAHSFLELEVTLTNMFRKKINK